MQDFVSALVDLYKPSQVEPDPARTRNRLRAVLETRRPPLGDTENVLLDALTAYWQAVEGTVQQAVHAASKSGKPLAIEDARRAVFQTLCAMYEISRALE